MIAGAPIETMTDLRQFCSRHAARFWPAQRAIQQACIFEDSLA
jgi:hypothetical protein